METKEAREMREMLQFLDALLNGPQRDLHKHKCTGCGCIWEHMTPPPEATAEEYREQHLCPKGCGLDIRMKYRGA